jgi:hypothetical protein
MKSLLQTTGYTHPQADPLTFGVVSLYQATR